MQLHNLRSIQINAKVTHPSVCVSLWSCTCKWLRLDTWVPQHMFASTPSISMIRIGPAWSSGSPRDLTWFKHTHSLTPWYFWSLLIDRGCSVIDMIENSFNFWATDHRASGLFFSSKYSIHTFSTAGSSMERSWTVTITWALIFSLTASSRAWSCAGFTHGVSSSMVLLWRPRSLKK